MGIVQKYWVPADPPEPGRYVVWRKDKNLAEWDVAYLDERGDWSLPRGEGQIFDVLKYMDVGGLNP